MRVYRLLRISQGCRRQLSLPSVLGAEGMLSVQENGTVGEDFVKVYETMDK